MKELTIEQKAKAYDEALETARKINSGEGVAAPPDWTICEVIFPELKDSEDERIRKHIIEVFRDHFSGEDCDKCIAWLEKQGEQKPDEEYNITGISSNKSQGKLGEIIKNLKTTWSEEDENYHRICLDLCTGMPNGGVYAPYIKDEAINWLKSLKDKLYKVKL